MNEPKVNRREFLHRSSAAFLGSSLAFRSNSPSQAAESTQKPNVILILTDDQGFGDVGVNGNDKIRTPNMDRLSREGVTLSQFYVCPVCAPTRACLMTGRYNYRTGVTDTWLGRAMMHPGETTMAEIFQASGYRTGIFGKWHLGDNYPMRPNDQGFQTSLVHKGGGIGQPADPPGNMYHDPILFQDGKPAKARGYCTDVFTDAAIRFIGQNKDQPYFAYLSTNAPHTPLQIDDKYVQPYLDMGLDETTAKVYGMIENIDDNIGRLLSKLRELHQEDNTIVIFMTDNGPQQPRYVAGLRGRKGSVYEGGVRVPCFIRWPQRFQADKSIDRIASHLDVLPTLINLCGLKKPDEVHMDGVDLTPLLTGAAQEWPDRTLFFQWHRGNEPEKYRDCAARSQRYKLVNGRELYDIEHDPFEKSDIASDHPDIVQQMRAQYEAWFRDVSSTRGYVPPRIYIGTPHENPVTLTRQDWRDATANWNRHSIGHWEVDVRQAGEYDVQIRYYPPYKDATAFFKWKDVTLSTPIKANSESCNFKKIRLPSGEGKLEAWIEGDDHSSGVRYVDVTYL
ncbi:MAG: arylsulfatase [Candidatus Hinthialibacter sp.]